MDAQDAPAANEVFAPADVCRRVRSCRGGVLVSALPPPRRSAGALMLLGFGAELGTEGFAGFFGAAVLFFRFFGARSGFGGLLRRQLFVCGERG
jgi:hypothetical protein